MQTPGSHHTSACLQFCFYQRYFSKENRFRNPKFGRRGVSYTDAKGKVPGRRSRLRLYDKELPEQLSVTIYLWLLPTVGN
jgi:hypothetical protein